MIIDYSLMYKYYVNFVLSQVSSNNGLPDMLSMRNDEISELAKIKMEMIPPELNDYIEIPH